MKEMDQDAEYQGWSEEARYRFNERMGMTFDDKPIEQCDPEGVEAARQVARAWELSERKRKKSEGNKC